MLSNSMNISLKGLATLEAFFFLLFPDKPGIQCIPNGN